MVCVCLILLLLKVQWLPESRWGSASFPKTLWHAQWDLSVSAAAEEVVLPLRCHHQGPRLKAVVAATDGRLHFRHGQTVVAVKKMAVSSTTMLNWTGVMKMTHTADES